MTLAERLAEYVRACFPALWVRTHEPDDALEEIARACRDGGWALATWDLDRGLELARRPGTAPAARPTRWGRSAPWPRWPPPAAPPCSCSATSTACSAPPRSSRRSRPGSPPASASGTFVVVLAPLVQIPVELERQFAVLEHELPGRDALLAIARGVATEPGELPDGPALDAVLDAAAGLTRTEAENSFSLALVRHGRLAPEVLWELKGQALQGRRPAVAAPRRRVVRRPRRPRGAEDLLRTGA